jgi:hypothetical protein
MYIRDIESPVPMPVTSAPVGKFGMKPFSGARTSIPRMLGMGRMDFYNAGMNEVKQGFGIGHYGLFNRSTYHASSKLGRVLEGGMRGLPIYFNVASTVQGYRENGMSGAMTGLGASQVSNYAQGVLWRAGHSAWTAGKGAWSAEKGVLATLRASSGGLGRGLKLGATQTFDAAIPAIMATAIVAGTYYTLKAGVARTRRTRAIEIGSPIIDPFGTAATMRQRSLQALSNSQLNGRSAFGTEAQLLHVPMMR